MKNPVRESSAIIRGLDFRNIHCKVSGSDKEDWKESAPFDKIVVTNLAGKT